MDRLSISERTAIYRTVLFIRIAHPHEPHDDLPLIPPYNSHLHDHYCEADPTHDIKERYAHCLFCYVIFVLLGHYEIGSFL